MVVLVTARSRRLARATEILLRCMTSGLNQQPPHCSIAKRLTTYLDLSRNS